MKIASYKPAGRVLYWGVLKKNWIGMCRPGFQKEGLRNWFFGLELGSQERIYAKIGVSEPTLDQNWVWKCKFCFKKSSFVSRAGNVLEIVGLWS